MQSEFWLQRWQEQRIGFHLEDVNLHLKAHWSRLALPPGSRVLVPLCGKSVDLVWLREQGLQVEAVELSELAVQAFFNEQQMAYSVSEYKTGTLWQAEGLRVWCGDFFELTPTQIGPIDAVYDRAALIAMPHDMRPGYVQQIQRLAGPVPQLVITLEYAQEQMNGPPFAVLPDEMRDLYGAHYDGAVKPDACLDVLPEHAHFASRGLTALFESVYLLQVPKK